MRLSRGVPLFAAVITLVGGSAPAAYGFEATASPAPADVQTTTVTQHPAGSSDVLIGVGTAGGIALVAGGLAANRRRHLSTPPITGVGAARGS